MHTMARHSGSLYLGLLLQGQQYGGKPLFFLTQAYATKSHKTLSGARSEGRIYAELAKWLRSWDSKGSSDIKLCFLGLVVSRIAAAVIIISEVQTKQNKIQAHSQLSHLALWSLLPYIRI